MKTDAPLRRCAGTLFFVALAFAMGMQRPVTAQLQPTREYDIKAGFLFNFIKFVDWPDDAFPTITSPINVDVLGRDPFDGALDRYLEGKTVGARPLVVAHLLAPRVSPAGHLVFVAASEDKQLEPVLAAYAKESVLTVSDMGRFAERGGVIGFKMEGRGLRFTINRSAAERSRLHVHAQLLSMAVLVGGKPQAWLLPPWNPSACSGASDMLLLESC